MEGGGLDSGFVVGRIFKLRRGWVSAAGFLYGGGKCFGFEGRLFCLVIEF